MRSCCGRQCGLAKAVEDEDVSLPTIDMAGEHPSTIARNSQVARSAERRDQGNQPPPPSDPLPREPVLLQPMSATPAVLDASRSLPQEDDARIGPLPGAGADLDIDGLDRPAIGGHTSERRDAANGLADEIHSLSVR